MNKLIILDRDGVINYNSDHYIKTPEEWHAIPGSLEAIARLCNAGYKVVIATNQSGVARGYYDIAMLQRIHEKLTTELQALGGSIDEIFFCPHHPDDHCSCRKPELGMFHSIRDKYNMDLADVYFIGDSYTDMQVAEKLPCKPIFIGKKNNSKLLTIPHFNDLAAAVDYILGQEQE